MLKARLRRDRDLDVLYFGTAISSFSVEYLLCSDVMPHQCYAMLRLNTAEVTESYIIVFPMSSFF